MSNAITIGALITTAIYCTWVLGWLTYDWWKR